MSTMGNSLKAGLQSGVKDALASIKAADDAKANVDNVGIFTKLMKKAEENAQAAL